MLEKLTILLVGCGVTGTADPVDVVCVCVVVFSVVPLAFVAVIATTGTTVVGAVATVGTIRAVVITFIGSTTASSGSTQMFRPPVPHRLLPAPMRSADFPCPLPLLSAVQARE